MALVAITINGTCLDAEDNPYASKLVYFYPLGVFGAGVDVVTTQAVTATTAVNGTFSVDLFTDDTANAFVRYGYVLPSGDTGTFDLTDAANPASLGDLIALGSMGDWSLAAAQAVLQALVDTHAAVKASTTVLGHVKVDGSTITINGSGVISSSGGGGGGGNVATDTIFDAKGDLPAGTGDNTATKLTVGANNTFLTPDSTVANGLKWIPAAAAKVLLALTKSDVGLGSVDNTADTAKPVSTAQQTALDLKANLAGPTFTGTVGGITKSMVGLANVDNTADASKPVSSAQQTALNLKANLASPTFTGTVGGITKSAVGLGNVDNTADTAKPVSTLQQAALDLKAAINGPTFTGTVGGITKTMVGLGSVDNTSDVDKPVSTAQATADALVASDAATALSGHAGTVGSPSTLGHVKPDGISIEIQSGVISARGYTPEVNIHRALGSTVFAETMPINRAVGGSLLYDGQMQFQAIWLPRGTASAPISLTGIKWFQVAQGAYTADNNNRIGLYSYSGGTLTLVASCADDPTLWKSGTGVVTKAFTSPYPAVAGCYFIGFLYNSSAQTTQPSIGGGASQAVTAMSALDYTNSAKSIAYKSAQTDLPTPQVMSGILNYGISAWFGLY